jgi:hypothetical protein
MVKSRDFTLSGTSSAKSLRLSVASKCAHLLRVIDNFGQVFFTIVELETATNPVYSIQSD